MELLCPKTICLQRYESYVSVIAAFIIKAQEELGSQNFWFCQILNPSWFDDTRFDKHCAIVQSDMESGNFVTKPKPFGDRYES